MPWLDKFIAKNPLMVWYAGTHPIVGFTVENMNERIGGKADGSQQRDFLGRSFEAQKKNPELVTDRIVRMWNIDNVFAGSDTTAVSLRSVRNCPWSLPRTVCQTALTSLTDIISSHADTSRHGQAAEGNR